MISDRMEPTERWKCIPGYEYEYRVSDRGHVQKRIGNGAWKKCPVINQVDICLVNLRLGQDNYQRVPLSRLVAEAFLRPLKPDEVVRHKNGCYADNALSNLQILPRGEMSKISGSIARTPVVKVDSHGEALQWYKSISEAARACRIDESTVRHHCIGCVKHPFRRWGFSFMYGEDFDRLEEEWSECAV